MMSNLDAVSDIGRNRYIVSADEIILVTGANGFIGSRVVRTLLSYGYEQVRYLTRSMSNSGHLEDMIREFPHANIEIVNGNLLSRDACRKAVHGVSVIYHLAAGTGKTFADCFLNSVVTTRNLLDAVAEEQRLERFVNVSSLAVYSTEKIPSGGMLDESYEIDGKLIERYDPYAYGKAKQDEMVVWYAQNKGLRYVILRPGVVFGPGKARIPGRVGIDTFGVFLHVGLNNRIPLTYVDNCAEAIVLAGVRTAIEGEVINIVDDDLPKSRDFLRMYKKKVKSFISIPVPYFAFYLFNYLWEKYSKWSEGQLPPAFNRRMCAAYFKGNTYSNRKAKDLLGWRPRVSMGEGLKELFTYVRGQNRQK